MPLTDPHQNISLPTRPFLAMHPLEGTLQAPTHPLVTLPISHQDTHYPVCLQIMVPHPLQVYLVKGHIPPEEFHHTQEFYGAPLMTCTEQPQVASRGMAPLATQDILTSS